MDYYKKYIKYKGKYINLKRNMIGGSNFNKKKLNNFYFNIKTYYILLKKLKPYELKITDSITMKKEDDKFINMVSNLKNSIYKDTKYKLIQKEVARKQKQLQNTLSNKYKIKFDNKRVSRAWCKLYEIYRELNFFKNIKKDINIFFICEAPGMWVHSTMDYFKRHMNKKFKWTAQSLKLDDMGLKDNYGFMKRTKKYWDYGILGDGDITRYKNLEYYKSKYGEFDCVLGDCGLSYNLEKKLTNYNLAIYQMLYSLTLLRKNGNFILKMVGIYKDPLFLSLLEYVTSMFNKVYILKSSRNFSSSENYIVGIGYNKTKDLSKNFIEILKKYKEGKYVYPLSNISSNFVKNYFNIKKELIDYEINNINFYKFLINNKEKLNIFKSNLDKYIKNQNNKWIKKYLL
jgi:23S rRNA U2552 (ribose-2'-O)-methylase RlmE/FtsJ